MSDTTKNHIISAVQLNSSRAIQPIDIAGSVTDIEIYEHLDMPFLTGKLVFVDTLRVMDRFDFQGAESLEISIKPNVAEEPVIKKFIIESIVNTTKTNDATEVVTFSFVEDILFKSNFKNVNKAYSGDPIDIMNEISSEFLNKKVVNVGDPIFQKSMKLIVPNMDPLKAMSWVKNRTTTTDGVPGYLFSSFALDDLIYSDLYTLLTQPAININKPFFYGSSAEIPENNQSAPHYIPLHSYRYEETENMFRLIKEGYVGADYQFYDALTGRLPMKHKFNFEKDVVKILPETDGKSFAFSTDFKIDEVKLQEQSSKRITQISSAGVYNEGLNNFKSYDEEDEVSSHAKKIVGRALKSHLLKSPITIRVPGQGFLISETNKTIGNVVRLIFAANRPASGDNQVIDIKKSGDYVIYASRHVFGTERYDLHLTCAKIKNFTSDGWPS